MGRFLIRVGGTAGPAPDPDPVPGPDPDPIPDPGPDPDPTPDPEPVPDPEPEPVPDPDPDPGPLPDPIPGIRILPRTLAKARAKAAADTPQWRAVLARVDARLPAVTKCTYQGDQLEQAADNALVYQCLKDSDPERAAKYGDKALAVVLYGLRDYCGLDTTGTRVPLPDHGDGTRATFPLLPGTTDNLNLSSFDVRLTTPIVASMTRGTPDGMGYGQGGSPDYALFDQPYYQLTQYIAFNHTLYVRWIADHQDGSGPYVEGVDWVLDWDTPYPRTPTYSEWEATTWIKWLEGGRRPEPGAPYWLEFDTSDQNHANSSWQDPSTYTVDPQAGTITFRTPPPDGACIWVEYQYGTSPAYQQTGDGRGGYNYSAIDAGFACKFAWAMATAIDWLWDHPPFIPHRDEACNMLVAWCDRVRDHGWQHNDPTGNMGVGQYAMAVHVAAALEGRHGAADRIKAERLAWRDQYLLAILAPPSPGVATMHGGWWSEGLEYGDKSLAGYLRATAVLDEAGWLDPVEEKAWASAIVKAQLHGQMSRDHVYAHGYDYPGFVYDGGNLYKFPYPFKHTATWGLASQLADDPDARLAANFVAQNYAYNVGDHPLDASDLLFRDPDAPAEDWVARWPPHYFADGVGLQFARSGWDYESATWMAFQANGILAISLGDFQLSPGYVQVWRGADYLLPNATAYYGYTGFDFSSKTRWNNLVVVDDEGDGSQVYRWNAGIWQGTPGVAYRAREEAAGHVYASADLAPAYGHNYTPGTGTASELDRSWFFLRSPDTPGVDYLVYHERATTRKDYHHKELRWCLGETAPLVAGGTFTLTVAVGSNPPETTAPIPTEADAATVKAALEALPSVGAGNTSVARWGPGSAAQHFYVAFGGPPSAAGVGLITGSVAGSTPADALLRSYTLAYAPHPGNVQEFYLAAPMAGDAWSTSRGDSKLYARSFGGSGTSIATHRALIGPLGGLGTAVVTRPVGQRARARYITAIQVGALGMAEAGVAKVASDDGALEGVIVGRQVVLFGESAGPVATLSQSYAFTAPAGTTTHRVADLTPGRPYTLGGAASGTATASDAGVLTFATTGTGSSQSVTIT